MAGLDLRQYHQNVDIADRFSQSQPIPETTEKSKTNSKEKLSLEEGKRLMPKRLDELKMILSITQKDTPGWGDCFLHALRDQLRYHSCFKVFAKMDINSLRCLICNYLDEVIQQDANFFPQTEPVLLGLSGKPLPDEAEGSPASWIQRMKTPGCYVDGVFIRLASVCIDREIQLIPLFAEDQIVRYPDSYTGNDPPIFMLYYNETRFGRAGGHYQSIIPREWVPAFDVLAFG